MGGKTKQIMAGGVAIGGGAPLSIQSMTNTKTADAEGTLAQLERLRGLAETTDYSIEKV